MTLAGGCDLTALRLDTVSAYCMEMVRVLLPLALGLADSIYSLSTEAEQLQTLSIAQAFTFQITQQAKANL
jgi:hypothetical protein